MKYNQVGALILRLSLKGDLEVLLVTTRRTGRWIIPKGWPMKGRKDHRAAAIEAFQEAGVVGEISSRKVGHFELTKYIDANKSITCCVDVYPLVVKKLKKRYKERGQRDLTWVPLRKASQMVMDLGLKKIFLRVEKSRDLRILPKETRKSLMAQRKSLAK